MIKMMILAPRRAGMTHAEFRRYVTEVHGPLVKSVPEVAADIRRYHYNFPIAGLTDAAFGHPLASHLGVVTEAWFDSVESQKQNMKLPRYLEIVRPDEHRFADGGRAVMHYAREVPVLEGERSLLKAFYFRRRRPGLSRLEFQERWLALFGQALAENPGCGLAITSYVQNHVVSEAEHPEGHDAKYFDVIDELFLTDVSRLAVLADHGPSLAVMRRLEQELLDPAATRTFIAETVVSIP